MRPEVTTRDGRNDPRGTPHFAAPAAESGEIRAVIAELGRLRTMVRATERLARIGTWDLDLRSNRLVWSEGTYRIFRLPPHTPVTLEQALGFYPPEAQASVAEAVETATAQGCPFDVRVPYVAADGEPGWLRSLGYAELGEDGAMHVFGVVQDLTREAEAEANLQRLASRDTLTDLFNRRVLLERLDEALSVARPDHCAALILLDLDGFKDVNDVHGHAVGDALLVEVAHRLRSAVRVTDTVARLGGDEFAVLLTEGSVTGGLDERLAVLLALFDTPVELESVRIEVATSIGAAVAPGAGQTAAEILRSADIALYHAKATGRRRASVYNSALGADVGRRASLQSGIRHALTRGQLDLFYQPIVDLRTGVVRGMEALLRWRHPERGLLAPAAFQEALDDFALAVDIGRFVLERAIRQMRAWLDTGTLTTCVNVNVSASQLRQGAVFVELILGLLGRFRLPAQHLKLELVESAFLGRRADAVAHTVAALRRHGIVVALDDFGTGFASLTHLKQFDVGRIKIDRSFVQDMCADASDAAIVRAMIDLGRNLGIRVTAEGIETAPQLAMLRAAGCDCGQGFLFSAPLASGEVPLFLRRWRDGRCQATLGTLASET